MLKGVNILCSYEPVYDPFALETNTFGAIDKHIHRQEWARSALEVNAFGARDELV